VAYPVWAAVFVGEHVEPAGGYRPHAPRIGVQPPKQPGQEGLRRTNQPPLLAAVYTGGGAAVALGTAFAHFDEHQDVAVQRDQVDFSPAAAQVGGQDLQALLVQIFDGPLLCGVALALGDRPAGQGQLAPTRPALRGAPAVQDLFLGLSGDFMGGCGVIGHGAGRQDEQGASMTKSGGGQGVSAWECHAQRVAAQSWPTACLYVVATPIGNLADLSLRALEALRQCDAIAAEDTRTTRSLLQAWGLDVPLLAAHRHNEQAAAVKIIERLQAGARIALVSDAGAPAVSDPGARIVRRVQQAGFRVVPVPGPSAVITALMASGATSDEAPGFAFAGFMPARSGARRAWLSSWLALPMPVVLFEAPHRVRPALADLLDLAGGSRIVTIARELTKRHEDIATLPLAQVMAWLQADAHRGQGEFVIVVHAPPAQPAAPAGLAEADQRLMQVLLDELSVRDAVRIGTRLTGHARDALYTWALAQRRGADQDP